MRMQVYTKLGGDDNLRKTITDCESVILGRFLLFAHILMHVASDCSSGATCLHVTLSCQYFCAQRRFVCRQLLWIQATPRHTVDWA